MTFMVQCWQVAAFAKEIGRTLVRRTLAGQPVVMYRTLTGATVAMADRCPHRYVPLSLGRLDGDIIECGYHGLRFDPAGKCVAIPGQAVVPARVAVRAFPTTERYGFVWIWLGDAADADAELVPDFHWMDDAGWAAAEGYHHIEANYRLLVDNLLDLSHETFVHPETIGNGAVATSPVIVTRDCDGAVRAHRDMSNCTPPPQFVALANFTGPIDRWHTTIYTPPGFCVIEVGAVPAGSGNRTAGFEARILNLITPETERSSHYFWAHARNLRRDDADLTATIRRSVTETFDQDKVILEAQQCAVDDVGSLEPGIVLGIDAGPVRGRRALAAALAAETPAGSARVAA